MAIMWDLIAKSHPAEERPSHLAWRLRFAQMLIASGWDPAVIREALAPDELGASPFAGAEHASASGTDAVFAASMHPETSAPGPRALAA